MDVGRNQRRQNRDDVVNRGNEARVAHLGHGRVLQQEHGSRRERSGMGDPVQQNRQTANMLVLGKSESADSYRAEMLGLCALHLLARALSEYHKIARR